MLNGRTKFWCRECDHVAKAHKWITPRCPCCRQPMTDMGPYWETGKKGKRSGEGSRPANKRSWEEVYSREYEARKLLKRLSTKPPKR